MHPFLTRATFRPVAREIALVHRQGNQRQVDLTDEPRHARDLDRVGMAEELPTDDEPAEFIAAQTRNVIHPAAFGLGQAVPTPERGPRSVNVKAVLLLAIDRGRLNASSVDR